MRSPIRALLVALVTTLGVMLVLPSVAEAKPKQTHSTKTAKTTKHVEKRTWKRRHAKPHARSHRAHPSHHANKHARKSPPAARPWKKKH